MADRVTPQMLDAGEWALGGHDLSTPADRRKALRTAYLAMSGQEAMDGPKDPGPYRAEFTGAATAQEALSVDMAAEIARGGVTPHRLLEIALALYEAEMGGALRQGEDC